MIPYFTKPVAKAAIYLSIYTNYTKAITPSARKVDASPFRPLSNQGA
jgi:hypothetical protein